jgi:hypothetical protein
MLQLMCLVIFLKDTSSVRQLRLLKIQGDTPKSVDITKSTKQNPATPNSNRPSPQTTFWECRCLKLCLWTCVDRCSFYRSFNIALQWRCSLWFCTVFHVDVCVLAGGNEGHGRNENRTRSFQLMYTE